MSDCGVFKKAVSALCVKIGDELMGKNKIRYPNTRPRILKGNTNSGISETFSFGIRNPGLWNPEFSSRNPESRIQAPLSRTPESTAWNLESKTVLVYLTSAKGKTMKKKKKISDCAKNEWQLSKAEFVLYRSIHYMLNSLHLNTKKLTSVWQHSSPPQIKSITSL